MRLVLIILFTCFSFTRKSSVKEQINQLHNKIYGLLDYDLNQAMTFTDSSLLLAQNSGLKFEEANSYFIKGYIHKQNKELSEAFLMYLKSSFILNNLNEKRAIKTHLDVLINIGSILQKHYKYNDAIDYYNHGLSLGSMSEFPRQYQDLLYNKAYVQRKIGDLSGANESLSKSIKLSYERKDEPAITQCLNLFGLINKDKFSYETAREYYYSILNKQKVSNKFKAQAYHNIAITYKEEGKTILAKENFQKALAIENSNFPNEQFVTLKDLATLHYELKDLEMAEKYALKAKNLHLSEIPLNEKLELLYLLSRILSNNSNNIDENSDRYYNISSAFNSTQTEIIKEKDKFQMDLVLAGFEAEQTAAELHSQANLYRWLAITGMLTVLVILLTWKLWFRWWKKGLWHKVYDTYNNAESSV